MGISASILRFPRLREGKERSIDLPEERAAGFERRGVQPQPRGARDQKERNKRSREICSPLGAAALALWLALPAAHARTLSFSEALALALAASPRLQESTARAAAADAAQRAAEGTGLPRLNFSVGATRSDNPLTVFGARLSQRNATFADFGAGEFTGPSSLGIAPQQLNQPGYFSNFNTRIEVEVPLYTGGQTSALVERARKLAEAARQGDAAARQALVYEVLAAYEGLRAARAAREVASAAERSAAALADVTERLYQQGAALKSDLLTARVNRERARLRRQAAENEASDALDRLRVLTGLPREEAIELGPAAVPQLPTGDPEQLVARALTTNPSLRALANQAHASDAAVASAQAAYRPRFNLVLRHEWNDSHLGLVAPSDTVLGVLTWEVFDMGLRSGEVSRARAEQDAALARLAQAQNDLRLRILGAWRSARLAAERVALERNAAVESAEAQRILTLRYEQGAATLADTLAGQARLDEARAALVRSEYEERLARAALLQALGELDPQSIGVQALQGAKQ